MSTSSIVATFDAFRVELDDHNDRRERIIKASRDITILSKKIIFLLHRLAAADEIPPDEQDNVQSPLQSPAHPGHAQWLEIRRIFARLEPDLVGSRADNFHAQISPGIQEYIEAISLAHYLSRGTLISFAAVQHALSGPESVPYLTLTVSDYLLGLSDLTGELMRLAISGLSRRGGRKRATDICAFVRQCKSDFERFSPHVHDLAKKQTVTAQSLQKIEDAVYTVIVRSAEYGMPPEALDDIVAQTVAASTAAYDSKH